jgi:hypothetical protein
MQSCFGYCRSPQVVSVRNNVKLMKFVFPVNYLSDFVRLFAGKFCYFAILFNN